MADSVRRQLRDGVTEGEQVPVVCVQDSLNTTACLHLFKHFLSGLSENISTGRAQAKGIVTVAIEGPYEFVTDVPVFRNNDTSPADWFQVLDCYSDPLGWEESVKYEPDNFTSPQPTACYIVVRDIRDLDGLTVSIVQRGRASVGHRISERFAVLFDSISPLLRFHSLPVLVNFLNELRSHEQVSSILFVVHAGLHDSRVVSALEYLASTVIFMIPLSDVSPKGGEYDSLGGGSLRIRQKRRNGRVREQIEVFHLDPASVRFARTVKVVVPFKSGKSNVPKVQFNLELTEREREDRSNVILPFEHQGDGAEFGMYDGRESSQLSRWLPATEKSKVHEVLPYSKHDTAALKVLGEIHYLRDSDDERPDSDEDPDDDLDI